jgi:hypothetical protein
MLIIFLILLSGPAFTNTPDLMKIKHVEAKPRIQDEYNHGKDAVLDRIVAMGKDAIPFLISRLSSERNYKNVPMFCDLSGSIHVAAEFRR